MRLPFTLLSFVCCAALGTAQQPGRSPVQEFVRVPAGTIALEHVRVIDGTGGPATNDQTILILGDKIAAIDPSASLHLPEGAMRMDFTGYTALPGLVGMHDHLFYPAGGGIEGELYYDMPLSFPRLYLACGVTTIRTTGAIETYTDLEIKREIEKGMMAGPKINVTGPYLDADGLPLLQVHRLTSPEDARRTVEYWAAEGAESFKAYNFLTRAELKAAIDETHKHGLTITGHLCSIGFSEAAELGIDDLEHGLVVDTEFVSGKNTGRLPQPQLCHRRRHGGLRRSNPEDDPPSGSASCCNYLHPAGHRGPLRYAPSCSAASAGCHE